MADKTKTIKSATDRELDDLIKRLRRENEAQNLIAELKRKSTDGYVPYDQQQGISTEAPIDSMYHVGVLGMHWGRRKVRSASSDSKRTNSGTKKTESTSEDHDAKTLLKKKRVSEMSNAELKKFNERMQLERSYKDLSKADVSAGKKWIMDVISSSSKQVATKYAAKYMTKGLGTLLNNKDAIGKTMKKTMSKKKPPIGFRI